MSEYSRGVEGSGVTPLYPAGYDGFVGVSVDIVEGKIYGESRVVARRRVHARKQASK